MYLYYKYRTVTFLTVNILSMVHAGGIILSDAGVLNYLYVEIPGVTFLSIHHCKHENMWSSIYYYNLK